MRILLAAAALVVALAPAADAADSCPNAPLRTGKQASLPDCRAWEQVSPAAKSANAMNRIYQTYATPDGSGFLSTSFGGAVPTESGAQNRSILSTRGSDWLSRGVDAPTKPAAFVMTFDTLAINDDATASVVASTYKLAPGGVDGNTNLYRRDLTQPSSFSLLYTVPDELYYDTVTATPSTFVDGTPDLRTIVFQAGVQVIDDVPAPPNSELYLYRASAGEVTLVSRLPGGQPTASTSEYDVDPAEHRITDDGRTITWRANGTGAYYRSTLGQTPVEISAPRRADSGNPSNSSSPFSAPDGSETIFASNAALTPETPTGSGGIYRYRASDGSLTDLTAQATSVTPAGEFVIRAVSPDRKLVWFTTSATLVPNASGTPNDYRLYVLDADSSDLRLVATINYDQEIVSGTTEYRFSPDGRRVAIRTTTELTGYDTSNPDCSQPSGDRAGACGQVYSWNSRTPDAPVVCASCGQPGQRVSSARIENLPRNPFAGRRNRVIDDAGRVFFDTGTRLVAADTDAAADVYEVTPGGGPALLTPGDGGQGARFAGISNDGSSAFFFTPQPLLAQDTDDLDDVYVARTDGGIAAQRVAPPTPAAPCDGETCKPSAGAQPARPAQGSTLLAAPPKRLVPSFSVRKPSARALRGAARTGRLSVVVKVNAPGTVSASLRGKLGTRKDRTAASGSRKASRAQTVRLTLRLSRRARSALRRSGRLPLRLTVAYSERLDRYRTTLTLTTGRTGSTKKGGAR